MRLGALIGGSALRAVPLPPLRNDAARPQIVLDLRGGTPVSAGSWYFCDGQGRPLGDLPGAREIAAGSPTIEMQLRSRGVDGRDALLRSGRFKSLYAYSRSMEVALRECMRWPSICLDASVTARPLGNRQSDEAPAESLPIARFLLCQSGAFLAHVYRHLFVDARWRVGVVRDSPASFLSRQYRPKIEWLREQRDFFADPFVLRCDEGAFILGESLDATTRNGFITAVAVDAGGCIVDRRTVLRCKSHLSYPYVFKDGDDWYLVPESAEQRCIALYSAVEFPYEWTRVATLIDGIAACDSTIIRHEGRWWLFCTDRSRDSNLNLFLFHAQQLTGPWTPHVANPVKTDVRSTRPAGMPFVVDGALYRPAQDCAESYGAAIRFNRVCKLNEREYEEEEVVASVLSGMHTISYADGIVAVDAKREVFASPRLIARRLSMLAARALRVSHAC